MARKHGFLLKADKNITESVWGWKPGRPTASRRLGRQIAATTGWHEDEGTALVDGVLLVGAVVAVFWAASKMQAPKPAPWG